MEGQRSSWLHPFKWRAERRAQKKRALLLQYRDVQARIARLKRNGKKEGDAELEALETLLKKIDTESDKYILD